jgi:hypothetical protein
MTRAIGAHERARSASARLQHLWWHGVLEVVADSAIACLLKNPWMKTGLGICGGEGDRFSGASTACISLIVASTMMRHPRGGDGQAWMVTPPGSMMAPT